MNVVTLNICGTKKRRKRVWVNELCFRHNIHFLGLQESKMSRFDLLRIKSLWGNYRFDFACSLSLGRSGGIISIWDTSFFKRSRIWCHQHYVIVKGTWTHFEGDFFMINVYAPQEAVAKATLWNSLLDFIRNHSGRFMLFGDFNVVRCEEERLGSEFSQNEANAFNSFIDEANLVDLPLGGRSFTYMNFLGTKLSKLDRFLLSPDCADSLIDVHATVLDRGCSDHSPVLLHLQNLDYGPTPFKFFRSLLLRNGADDLIKREYSADPNVSFFLLN
ncbi:uncharacterized protein [Rutidosis leptorrhynchoides]|uniref:uncharacterized protein n=1 Tax=Rutidosis leptorrhynchoides TaxID=125765 RepID=UPI003A9A1532